MPQDQTGTDMQPAADMATKKKKRLRTIFLKALLALFALAFVVLVGYFFIPRVRDVRRATEFSQVWRLVPEKVSKSAAIRVYAPAGMTSNEVAQKAKFEPEIPGHWVADKTGFLDLIGVAYGRETQSGYEYAEYQPDEALTEGLHYGVRLAIDDGNELYADFLATEDPQIDAIFPNSDMEAPEDSKVSIVFNRPMVALSTADVMEPKDLPVELTPETEGKWKWISTNTLQFVPATTLKLSSNYKVMINSGLKSLDGLAVSPIEGFFKTRSLRYLDYNAISDTVIYNKPYRIYFNQPVDLDKTVSFIKVVDSKTNEQVEFMAQYKKIDNKGSGAEQAAGFMGKTRLLAKSYYDVLRASLLGAFNGEGGNVDKSVIEIYGKKDRFGRKNYWDTDGSYKITISKAYPAEGDIIISSERQNVFVTSGMISGYFEEGGRSEYNGKDMFDPQGKLGVRFYEDIDLERSNFSASVPVIKKEYGKKCSDERLNPDDSNCNQVDDKKTVLLTFDGSRAGVGQKIVLKFERIVSVQGDQINGEAIQTDISVYQPLEFHVATRNGRVDLNYITLCSNNPLAIPEDEDLLKKIDANLEFELFGWGASWRRNYNAHSSANPTCALGEFETNINVGLIPSSSYALTILAADLFGQTVAENFHVLTGPMVGNYTDIFLMQQESSVTTADRTTLTFGSKNITYADVSVCKLSAYDYYRQRVRLDNWDQARNDPLPKNCLQSVQKRVQLPERYWLTNYIDINVVEGFEQPVGNYIVTLSHPLYKYYDGTARYLRSFVTVTGLSAVQKALNIADYLSAGESPLTESQLDSFKNIYWVNDIKTLAPVAEARVTLYSGSKIVGEALTDASGVAMIKPVAGADLAVVQYGNDSTIIAGYDTKMNYVSDAYNVRRAYVYTDRPIYRPGDKVSMKGILRLGYDGNYQMWNNSDLQLEIRDPRWNVVATPTASVNQYYGTFTAEYVLDNAAALGNYQICAKGSRDCGQFSVKEYVPAAFKVDAKTSKDEYISGDKVKVDVDAQYYFGVPVADAEVEYTISSQNYYFDKFAEGGYNFGFHEECADPYYCYGDKFIGRGTLKLDSDGKGTISEIFDLQKIAGDGKFANSKIIVFDITVKNSMGQSISAQKSVIVHAGEIYLGAKASPYFAGKGQVVSIEAQAVDIKGNKSSADNVSAAIYKVDWVYAKRQEAGGYYNYDWSKKRDLLTTIDLHNKGNGQYAGSTSFANEGEYEIDITGEDKRGIMVMSRDYVYVYGSGIASIRLYDDNQLTIKAEKENVNSGEQGSLIIESPFSKAKALISIERGKVFKYEIVEINGSMFNYKFDVTDDYAPNVYVSVLLQSADPAVKFGTQEFKVNSDVHDLNIEVTSDKKTYKPGDTVVLNFHASDNNNKPVMAEVSAAVVDVSVLALAGNPKKDPLIFFYDGLPLTVNTYSSVKEVLLKVDKERRTKGGSGGGSEESDNNVRGEFRDTAFWNGSVTTDDSGNARLEFKLPDNLTTWQAEAVGVTEDTRLGAAYTQFISRNDLMVVPVKPRFIVPGDKFYLGAQVFNQSAESRKVKISFTSDTLVFTGKNKEIVSTIKSGESKTVYFDVMAPLDQTRGTHTFTVTADGGGISDAIKQTIAVVPNLTYEAVATANYITNGTATDAVYLPDNVSKEQGGLTVRSSATLAVFLSDALNYFIAYPYGCTEQISSRLKAMAAVKGGLSVPNLADKFKLDTIWINGKKYTIDDLIEIGLNRIYKNQCDDGGYGMWNSNVSDYYATLQAVSMFEAMKSAGVAINQSSLDRALGYLNSHFNYNLRFAGGEMSPNQVVATAAVLLGDGNTESPYGSVARAAIVDLLAAKNRNNVLNDVLSNRALAQLSIILSRQDFAGALNDVNAVLDNRIAIDSRGAFLQVKGGGDYDHYETTISDTALYLKSLAAGRRDTVYTDKVVRWILGSRAKDGAWGSTQNTLAVVTAFTDFLKWKHETESEFTLTTTLNGSEISKKDFNAQSILEQSVAEVPASKFITGGNNIIGFSQSGKAVRGGFYYDMGLKYYLSGLVAPRDEGFSVSRSFYALDDGAGKTALTSAVPGQVIREHIEITLGRDRRFVAIEDFIPAGMEIVDMSLATEQKSLKFNDPLVKYNLLRPDYTELRDDRVFIYVSYLAAGTYQFDYYVRALAKGDYLQLPCVASEFYNPENFGRSASSYFEVK